MRYSTIALTLAVTATIANAEQEFIEEDEELRDLMA